MGSIESALVKDVEEASAENAQRRGSSNEIAIPRGSKQRQASYFSSPSYPHFLGYYDSDQSSFDSGIGSSSNDKSRLLTENPIPNTLVFKTEGILGKGRYGIVYRVVCNGQRYAIKSRAKRLPVGQQIDDLTSEARVLYMNRTWKNHFLPNLFGCFDSPTRVFFVTESHSCGNLQEIQGIQANGVFSPQIAQFYCAEIAAALGFLHSKNVIHRDLKPSNIMVNHEGHIVLVDLRLVFLGQRSNEKCGSVEYMSPERLAGFTYDHSADWWSLGVMMCFFLLGKYPLWSRVDSNEVNTRNLLFVTNIEFCLANCVGWPHQNTFVFVADLLTKDPSIRLGYGGLDEVLGHAYFSNLDKQAVLDGQLKPPYMPPKRPMLTIEREKTVNEEYFRESFECPINHPSKCCDFYYISPDLLTKG